ncbi:MAG: hypothetical protein Q8L60_10565 [Gammaproteobacteria bacterium]|nr:hypothetical protein [Gammaproteobacteria bacterium]MDP2346790.1 hypothetical protein [Gammaproteobacteria bacterium]
MSTLTMKELKAIFAHARKNAIPPFVIDGEPYIMLDSETGKLLHPDEWQIVEQENDQI